MVIDKEFSQMEIFIRKESSNRTAYREGMFRRSRFREGNFNGSWL
jgi:hypothetical protein